eukprot:2083469-Pyramimonas_sp.AAC.1
MTDHLDAGSAGIFSRRTNQTQEVRAYSHDEQSDAGLPTAALDTGTVELTVKTLLSYLIP